MKEETKRLLLDALKEEFRAIKLPQPEDALRMQREAFEGKLLTEFSAHEIGVALGIWNHAEEDFGKMSEPTARERDELLAKIRGKLRYQVRDAMLDIGQKMPHRPGGRPEIPKEKKQKAIQWVGKLMGQGDSYAEAVAKAAAKFKMSAKTVQRAWQAVHRKE